MELCFYIKLSNFDLIVQNKWFMENGVLSLNQNQTTFYDSNYQRETEQNQYVE